MGSNKFNWRHIVFLIIIGAVLAFSAAYFTISSIYEQSAAIEPQFEENWNKVKSLNSSAESVSFNNIPIEIELQHDGELTFCEITLKPDIQTENANLCVIEKGKNDEPILYLGAVKIEESAEFHIKETENIISIIIDETMYTGAFLVYGGDEDEEILYDLYMSRIDASVPQVDLSKYSDLSESIKESLRAPEDVVNVKYESIENRELIYAESVSDNAVIHYNIDNGGNGYMNFFSEDPNAEYRIEIWYNVKYYDPEKKDTLMQSFEVKGSESCLPVLMTAGHRYIKVIRKDNGKANAFAINLNSVQY